MLLCLWAHELRLLAYGVGRIRLRLLLLPVLASHVFAFEGALGVADRIMAHLLIAEKAGALHRAFRGGNLREHIRIEFVLDAVPEQFLALVDESVHDVADTDSAAQMPKLLLIIIPRRIRLDISLNVEFLVELFEKHAFLKRPARGILDDVDVPALGDNPVLDDTRIADERIDTIRGHHRH